MSEPMTITGVRLDELLERIDDHADSMHDARRLPDPVDDALRASGINRMLLPASLGGLETPTADAVAVIERLAVADASTAWCAVIGGASNIFAGYLPEDGARRIFADPDRGTATMFSPLGTLESRGGVTRLSGRWPFVSNCRHADWIGLVATWAGGEGGPQLVFVRTDDVTIEDTWDTVGLRATGSHHVSVHDVAVDASTRCEFVGPPWADGPLWRVPVFAVILPWLAAVPIGIAQGALDDLARQAREGRTAVRRVDLAADPQSMADYADAAARLVAARAGVVELARRLHGRAMQAESIDPALLARVYLANGHAVDTAVDVTVTAHRLGGGGAVHRRSPLLRALNDVMAARQHYQFAHEHRVALGRVLTGVADTYPPYIT